MTAKVYIHQFSSLSAAGDNAAYREAIFADKRLPLPWIDDFAEKRIRFGQIDERYLISEKTIKERFPHVLNNPTLRWGRGNRLAAALAIPLVENVNHLIEKYGADRVALVIGASVAGMTETERFFFEGKKDSAYSDTDLEMYNPARALKAIFKLKGPVYTISTACTSSTKAMISAARLIQCGAVDAALCGGLDTKSLFTIAGFESLGAVSSDLTQPFGEHRDGINLGEGGALFILDKESSGYELSGWGESSDAYHISSPEPNAIAVQSAIKHALQMSEIEATDFVCAHGTGTRKNDEMEALAIHNLMPNAYVCSTKTVTGHTLGGAGALCAAAALFSLDTQKLPTHLIEDNLDPLIATIKLTVKAATSGAISSVLCNSFAFGGNNAVIVIKKNNNAAH
ncbi:MAG TPA: beta-ketoacyl-[acyl-carrier-protein] synthase II [Candidatus Aphodousia faecalis]|nr:beta-ketoacyl-[acyl-carrier-protein] synthase II [Candidatus Aphodousia faecalis]